MKFLLQIAIWCFFVVCTKSQNLTCSTGAVRTITPPGILQMDTRKSVQCPNNNEPQNCLRVETTLRTTFFFDRVHVAAVNITTFALCVNDATCMAYCSSLQSLLLEDLYQDLSEAGIAHNGHGTSHRRRDCKRACCKTDNCNEQSVETILQIQQETTPGITPEMTTVAAEATTFVEATTGGAEELFKLKQPLMVLFVILWFWFGNIVS